MGCSTSISLIDGEIKIVYPNDLYDIRHGRVTEYKRDDELDRMWNEGTLNEERIESFRHLHERTPYNKPKYTFNK